MTTPSANFGTSTIDPDKLLKKAKLKQDSAATKKRDSEIVRVPRYPTTGFTEKTKLARRPSDESAGGEDDEETKVDENVARNDKTKEPGDKKDSSSDNNATSLSQTTATADQGKKGKGKRDAAGARESKGAKAAATQSSRESKLKVKRKKK